jgi:hypothetical protein
MARVIKVRKNRNRDRFLQLIRDMHTCALYDAADDVIEKHAYQVLEVHCSGPRAIWRHAKWRFLEWWHWEVVWYARRYAWLAWYRYCRRWPAERIWAKDDRDDEAFSSRFGPGLRRFAQEDRRRAFASPYRNNGKGKGQG